MSTNPLHRLLRGTASAAALLALALLAQGCVADNDDCPAPPAPENNITLQFMVVTPSPAGRSAVSRADNCDADEQGSAAENYINTADMQFFLFDADRKLLRTFRPEITSKDDERYTWYELKAMFNEPYFDAAVKSGQENVSFYILVTANTSGLGGQYFGVVPGVTTIDDMAQQLRTFNCPPRRDQDNNYTFWHPDIAKGDFIPMSGLQKFTVSTAELVASTYEEPLDISPVGQNKDIPMLRAMAKIEVIDHLEFAEGETYDDKKARIMIEKVELCGFNSTGTILPWMGTTSGNTEYNLPQWTDVSINVVNPTIPGNNPYIEPNEFSTAGYAPFDHNRIITFYGTFSDKGNKPIGATGFPTFTAYIPEYSLQAIGGSEKPYIVVTLTNSQGNEAEGETIKQLKLVSYKDGAPQDNQPIEEMLRNHIYRYQVNSADNPENIISVGYTVCPWYTPTVDIPSFD